MFPWRLYLAATLVGAFAGVIGGAFHALLDQAASGREMLRGLLSAAPVPGWLLLMPLGALVLVCAMWLVRRFAPETAGSGVQEVEAILAGERKLRWRAVLPIKFVAGTLAVGSGLVLGREGPTIHMGAALGQLASERLGPRPGANRALIAAGAAAGLATAFNAPLASIVFVTEELREHFEYRFATIQSVILACCAAVIVSGWMLGQGPDMPMPDLKLAPIEALPLFLVLGVLIGALGVLFNRLLLGSVAAYRALGPPGTYAAAAATGLILGALIWFAPATVGGGETLVENLLHGQPALFFLLALLAVRLLTTVGSYGLGLPGGIFAPMLALGTICGAAFAALVSMIAPALALEPEVFAVAAMGALFAATVRAPLTGIILVIELTGAQSLALPIILTCLSATFTAEGLGGRPVYASLLGLQNRPAVRTPVRRIAAAAMILVVFIAVERIDVARQGTGMQPTAALAEVSPSLPQTDTPAVDAASIQTAKREAELAASTAPPASMAGVVNPSPQATAYPGPMSAATTEQRSDNTGTEQTAIVGAASSTTAPWRPGRQGESESQSAPAPAPAPAAKPDTRPETVASAAAGPKTRTEAQSRSEDTRVSGTDAELAAKPAPDIEGTASVASTPNSAELQSAAADQAAQPHLATETAVSANKRAAKTGSSPAVPTAASADSSAQAATPSAGTDAASEDARFSIQLISFRNVESLMQFAQDEGLAERALQLESNGQRSARWHAVLLGAYADRSAAEAALRTLPPHLKRLDPMIRSLDLDERLVPITSPADR
jgi:H+/Cl- antiporter ClcA